MKYLGFAAVLGLACLAGCQRARSPLLGKWVAVDGEGLEFRDNGELALVGPDKAAVTGKYKVLDAGSVEMDLRPAVAEPFQAKTACTADELTVTVQRKQKSDFGSETVEEYKSTWKGAAADAPTADDGLKDLAGHWVAGKETYDFFADGTFAHSISHFFSDDVHLGTWTRSSGALECTYPDSGRTEKLVAGASGDELTLGQADADHPAPVLLSATTFRRDGDAVAERKPIQPGVLTAYQLFQEFKADPDAAEKKYKDKEIQIAGIVQDIASGSSGIHVIEDGKRVNEDNTVTKLCFSTGEQDNVLCVFPGLAVDVLQESADNPLHHGRYAVLKGKCLGMGKDEGSGEGFFHITVGGDGPKVRFAECKVVSPMKPEDKK